MLLCILVMWEEMSTITFSKRLEERDFVVVSGASTHMMSFWKNIGLEESWTVRFKTPNGCVDSKRWSAHLRGCTSVHGIWHTVNLFHHNEIIGDGYTPMHTSRSQCQQRKCGACRVDACGRGDERVDGCSTHYKQLSSHRGFGTSKPNVRRWQQRSPSRERICLEKTARSWTRDLLSV